MACRYPCSPWYEIGAWKTLEENVRAMPCREPFIHGCAIMLADVRGATQASPTPKDMKMKQANVRGKADWLSATRTAQRSVYAGQRLEVVCSGRFLGAMALTFVLRS